MSQLQVTGEAKIRDIQGPVVANSGVITALNGAASQYVRGDGTLADFPTSTGGGSSVSYYLNSSVSQGTIGGVAYRELSKEPIIGAGTDITISANGYVASYITDANDPDVLSVPGGNFNCEFYFSVNNNTGSPTTYAELYKYNGTTFTLLGSSVGVPESLNQGTTIAPYYFAIPVATAALALTDRLAIRIYVSVDGRVVTLHTENSHLCQVVTTFSKGMVSLNNLTDQSQFITTGTSGTDFNIVSTGDTHTFNLPVASATNTGKLSSSDWSTFNNKQNALTNPVTGTGTTNTLPKFTGTSAIGNSNITDTGSLITLGSNAYVTNNLGLGNSSLTQYGFRNSLNITGAGNSTANYSDGQIQSGVTGRASYYETFVNTAAAAFTNAGLYHYRANQSTFGAGSTVTSQYGFSAESTLVGATNNYGFFGNIPSGTNRWNLYMNGTAANYLAGDTSIGTTTGGYKLNVNGTIFSSKVTNNAAISNSPADASLLLYAPTTTNFYGGIIGWAEGNIAASISSYDDGTGGALGLSISTGNATSISERLRISSTGASTFTSSVSAASFIPTSSTIPTNGMYLSGTNTLGFATNSTLDMTLNEVGSLGLGTTSLTGYSLRVNRNPTGATTSYGITFEGTIQSDVTTGFVGYRTNIATLATTFTSGFLVHYSANQATIGAGSTVTNQFGFIVESNVIGATNNFGFYGNIPAAANRWNLYMNGTANNYMAGSLGIGSTTLTGINLNVNKNNTGATTTYNIISQGNILSDVTSSAHYFTSSATVQNTAFTLTNLYHYRATGASSFGSATVTNQYGFIVDNVLTGATNNFAFYGNIAAGANRWNLYMGNTANNYMAGSLGIGSTSLTGYNLRVQKNITGGTTAYAGAFYGQIQTDVTNNGIMLDINASTAASVFTLNAIRLVSVSQGSFGAGSVVVNQYGYYADNLTGATNNYGFFGNIASGTNRWNLYMAGTAANYMAGTLSIGTTTSTRTVDILGAAGVNTVLKLEGGSSSTQTYLQLAYNGATNAQSGYIGYDTSSNLILYTANTERLRVNNVGLNIGGNASNNASAKVQIDSTTQGVLLPRMTAAQRTAIATPAEGLIVVQTDGTQGLYLYIGAAWHAITML